MKLFVIDQALVLDVVANDRLVCVATDRVDVIAACPQCATPQLGLDAWDATENLTSGDTFYRLDDLRRTHRRYRLNQKMHVVFVRANFDEDNLVAIANVEANITKRLINLIREDRTTVLRGANNVVEQHGDVVAFVDEVAHICTSYQTSTPHDCVGPLKKC